MIADPAPVSVRRFVGAVAMVTGGGGGIGSAVSRRFAVEGATVVVCGVSGEAAAAQAAVLQRDGYAAEALVFDVADAVACADAIASVVAAHGRLDVLVNNAGVNLRGDLLSLQPDDWARTFAVNLDAMFHLCRAVVPVMSAAGGGSIVNVASQWGLHPASGHLAYNTSKAAVVAFTQSLARDHAPGGVRVNAVCPGEIHTPMLEAGMARSGRTIADLDRLVPAGRVGRPEEVAALVAFLASDEAPFMCGSVVEITGAQPVG